jgi:hypothetical protein
MSAKNYPKILEYYDATAGFLYATADGQRFLQSIKSGFAANDKADTTTKSGNVDWTDGKKTVTWNAVHRYSRVDSYTGQSVFMGKVEYNFNLGRIAGAAFKSDTFIVLTFHASTLTAYFLKKDKTVLGSQVVGSYDYLTQIVAISPDCSKASFIAIPTGQEGLQTVVVELTINLVDKVVSVVTSTIQDVADDLSWINFNSGTNGTRVDRQITNAIDFDKNNSKKTLDITTGLSITESGSDMGDSFIESYPFVTSGVSVYKNVYTSTYKKTGTWSCPLLGAIKNIDIDLGGTTTSYYLKQGMDITNISYRFVSDFIAGADHTAPEFEAELAYLQAHLPSFDGATLETYEVLFVNDLDLRKDLIAYTQVTEVELPARDGNYALHTQYILKIGAYQHNYRPDHHYTSNISANERGDFMAGINVPMHNNFFTRRFAGTTIPYIDIQSEVFYVSVTRNGGNYLQRYRQNTHYDDGDFILKRIGMGLTDKNDNKMIWIKPICGVQYDEFLEVTFAREDAVVVKITSTNQVLSNQIEILKGVV